MQTQTKSNATAPPEVTPLNCPGDPLCPCEDNHECRSGWCVEDRDGWKCTKFCIGDCWPGWTCVIVDSAEAVAEADEGNNTGSAAATYLLTSDIDRAP